MRRIVLTIAILLALTEPTFANSNDTIYAKDMGLMPNTFKDCTQQVQKILDFCKKQNTKVLVFEKGRYDFWTEHAATKNYFISNTSSEEECPSKVKTIAILIKQMKDLSIIGNDATWMFHGKVTMLALDKCENILIENIHFDFERPGGSECTVLTSTDQDVVVKFHKDSKYYIDHDKQIHLYGEGWRTNISHCIEHHAKTDHFTYSLAWKKLSTSEAIEIAPNIVKFNITEKLNLTPGNTLTIRDIIRDQVGIFILESKDITLKNTFVHYMHGLGIVSQYCKNINMLGVNCMPTHNSGRILASSADFMHFSGCSGLVKIEKCNFSGAQDDPINVHGTNLRIIDKISQYQIRVRFMHPQSYGYNAFFKGDTIAYVQAKSMIRGTKTWVKDIKRESDRTLILTLNNPIPNNIILNEDCIENLSCTPEVEIRDCYFTRTSTRGTLITTPRRVVIENNTYYKTGMSAILIEGDAQGWYESGPVKDVLIQNNKFIDCAYNGGPGNAVIAIHPSNSVVNPLKPVHRNIRILNNSFDTWGNPILYAKSTAEIIFSNNSIVTFCKNNATPIFEFNGCSLIRIFKNIINGYHNPMVKTTNMKANYIKTDLK